MFLIDLKSPIPRGIMAHFARKLFFAARTRARRSAQTFGTSSFDHHVIYAPPTPRARPYRADRARCDSQIARSHIQPHFRKSGAGGVDSATPAAGSKLARTIGKARGRLRQCRALRRLRDAAAILPRACYASRPPGFRARSPQSALSLIRTPAGYYQTRPRRSCGSNAGPGLE